MTAKFKRAAAAVLAAAMTVSFGTVSADAAGSTKADKKKDELSSAMSKLNNVKLKNKTVKWLAHYDLNSAGVNSAKPAGVELFEKKYGGKIEWYPTTWSNRYNDLSTFILGGQSIDIFPGEDVYNLPKGVVNGTFQYVDDYIDLKDSIWKNTKNAMETYQFGGKHFMFVTDVKAGNLVYYNTATVKKHKLDDPWELYEKGEWNWNTFKKMLKEFVDEDEERYGIDGYWSENALLCSAGMPSVKNVNGHVVSKLKSKTVKKAMDYQYGLYEDGLVFPREWFNWSEQPQFMGTGNELFYIGGEWIIDSAPDEWTLGIPPKNLGVVPVPSPKGYKPYQGALLDGYVLCKGAENPEGAARLAECSIIAAYDKDVRKLERRKKTEDYGWTSKTAGRVDKINALARKYPVVDLASGCSADIASFTTQGGDAVGLRAALHGYKWDNTLEEIGGPLEMLIGEVDDNLQKKVSEYDR